MPYFLCKKNNKTWLGQVVFLPHVGTLGNKTPSLWLITNSPYPLSLSLSYLKHKCRLPTKNNECTVLFSCPRLPLPLLCRCRDYCTKYHITVQTTFPRSLQRHSLTGPMCDFRPIYTYQGSCKTGVHANTNCPLPLQGPHNAPLESASQMGSDTITRLEIADHHIVK